MSCNGKTGRRLRAAGEAAEWADRLRTQLSPVERGEFVDWLRESPLHVAELLRFTEIGAALSRFKGWEHRTASPSGSAERTNVIALPYHQSLPAASAVQPIRRRMWRYGAGLAAGLIFAVVGVLFMSGTFTSTVVKTQSLERREITLADGSIVTMAPETIVRIQLSREERAVALERGEALFHVAKDPLRPFVVSADYARVRAVGTAFSVEREPSGIVITVAEGRVAVTPKNPSRAGTNDTQHSISLGANEQLRVSLSGVAGTTRQVDGRAEFAWAAGQLIFENNSVAEVVRRFNERNQLQIRIVDPTLAARPVSGIFNASDPESFVSFLETAAGAIAVTRGAQEILVGSPAQQSPTSNTVR